jgi:thiol:disulfide interchange protein DsbA
MQASRADTFRVIDPPQPIASGARIEVIEFFYYTCVDCNALLRSEEEWVRQLPRDVAFKRIPVAWNAGLLVPAQAYESLAALGQEGQFHDKIFQAIYAQHVFLNSAADWADWATRNGLDRNRWNSIYASPAVTSKAQASLTVWKRYGADRAPSFVVDGKYYTDVHVAFGADKFSDPTYPVRLLRVLDDLIARARADRAAKKP